MLMVVAPSSSAICTTSAVYSRSARVASIGENSTSSQYCLEWATAARAWPLTSSRVVWSWYLMWMSLVEMKVWMRGRSESLTAFQAASMSWTPVRARPQITGPCTSRAMACTASKSPGEAIGKPASMMSTPRRASWWAISSFSCLFSEMPGDCSPSRRVVSKTRTRSFSSLTAGSAMSFSVPFVSRPFLLGLRLRGRHALFPPRGEEEKSKGETERHGPLRLHGQYHLADVLALGHEAVRVAAAVEGERLGHDRPDHPAGHELAQACGVLRRGAVRVPDLEHVQADHPARAVHHPQHVEARHAGHGAQRLRRAPPLALHARGGADEDHPPAGAQQRVALLEAAPADA